MLKETGRLKPAKNMEVSKLKGKKYKCGVCGKEVVLTNIEFGTTMYCEECGGVLSEFSTINFKEKGKV